MGRTILPAALLVLLAGQGLLPAQEPSEQAKRGRQLFFESANQGSRCGNCHSLENKGSVIAPDLRRLAGLSPRALKTAILSTVTEYVVAADVKGNRVFPALKGEETDTTIVLWDLSKMPPEARSVKKADVNSYGANRTWKHPPASADLTSQQLADVIAYLRFVAKGDTRPVEREDVN